MMNTTSPQTSNDQVFERKLSDLINEFSMENRSGTPDYILAHYLMDCLRAYESVKAANDKWDNTAKVPNP